MALMATMAHWREENVTKAQPENNLVKKLYLLKFLKLK
jgi:hypothetical protein